MKRWLLVLLVLASARADEPAAIVYARVPFADAQFKMEDYRFWRSVFIVADAPAVLMSNEGAIYVAAPAGQAVAGTVAWRGGAGWRHATFRIADPSKHQTTKAKFKKARAIRYRRLVDEGHAGAALFRYRWSSLVTDEDRRGAARRRADRHDFDLMTGGRAFAENLQLDRHLPESAAGEATVELDSIKGITVRPYEWKLDDEPIPVDRLARFVPENQYAVFFKSAAALRATAALLGDQGTPLLRWMEPRAEDLHTLERYERQLGVDLATLPGKSVAITGSDPYFEDGTDLALLLEGVSADDLPRPAGRRMTGSAFGTAWHGFVAERREVSSYRANVAGAAVVSNSRVQLERILAVAAGKKSGMATLDEFRFFRRRYALGGDEAFLMVTDGAIRNWCGPRWRIAASRRRRALSEMLDWQAARADGDAAPARAGSVDLALRIDGGRVVSDRYGAIDFLTPIAELDFTRVTEDEARLYGVWRDGYERFWSNFFDPIAARLAHTDDGLELDVSVMPLIANSDYRRFIRVAQGVTIGATAGDRHDGSLLHMVFAINAESKPVKDAWQFAGAMMGIEVNPMAWLGTSWSVYVDESPFFTDLAQAENPEEWFEENWYRFPGALQCEIKNPGKLVVFLVAMRRWVEGAVPGMTEWSVREYGTKKYTRIKINGPAEWNLDKPSIYYAVAANGLTVALDEAVLKRALDRADLPAEAVQARANKAPWIGQHLAMHGERRFLEIMDRVMQSDSFLAKMQTQSFGNLFVLNEWKRLFPKEDPVAVHRRFFGTTPVCPGNGRYVWNERAKTMESTVFGHPFAPKGADLVPPYAKWASMSAGATFEEDGLRARLRLTRSR